MFCGSGDTSLRGVAHLWRRRPLSSAVVVTRELKYTTHTPLSFSVRTSEFPSYGHNLLCKIRYALHEFLHACASVGKTGTGRPPCSKAVDER
jgi:hypothetical protein